MLMYFGGQEYRRKELWKSLALALEVAVECCFDCSTDVPGEGCRTRSRRLEKICEQWDNAQKAASTAEEQLRELGEYD
jgi:hypothetical protein